MNSLHVKLTVISLFLFEGDEYLIPQDDLFLISLNLVDSVSPQTGLSVSSGACCYLRLGDDGAVLRSATVEGGQRRCHDDGTRPHEATEVAARDLVLLLEQTHRAAR